MGYCDTVSNTLSIPQRPVGAGRGGQRQGSGGIRHSLGDSSQRTASRQKREGSRWAILEATAALLSERRLLSLSVAEVAERAGLARTAFYRSFPDLPSVLAQLVDDLSGELLVPSDPWWSADGTDPAALETSVAKVVAVFVRRGSIIRALVDAAAYDDRMDAIYMDTVGRFVAAVGERIRFDQQAGRTSDGLDPHETARALVWMTERYLSETFGREYDGVTEERAADVLAAIWRKTLYG